MCFTCGDSFLSLNVIICTYGVSTNENVVKKGEKMHQIRGFV